MSFGNPYCAALPPLGLTRIADEPDADAELAIVGDVAYISGRRDIWVLDDNATIDTFRLMHPDLGMHSNPSRVVKGPDETLYVGATFLRSDTSPFSDGVGLFALNNLADPIATWEARLDLVGFGSDLRGVANHQTGQPVRLLADGTIEELQFPEGTPNMEAGFVTSMSESGYAVGHAFVPGTIGDAASLWTPSGDHSFLDVGGSAIDVQDRIDGQGINIGWKFVSIVSQYGDFGVVHPNLENYVIGSGEGGILLTNGDFAVLRAGLPVPYLGFQPSFVPGVPERALPIEEFFPELAAVRFDDITDVVAADDHIFITLSSEDGLYLFAARDPSVIPEPGTWGLAVLLAALGGVLGVWRRQRCADVVSSIPLPAPRGRFCVCVDTRRR